MTGYNKRQDKEVEKMITFIKQHDYMYCYQGGLMRVEIPYHNINTGKRGVDIEIAYTYNQLRIILGY